jgi:hypothetical protein
MAEPMNPMAGVSGPGKYAVRTDNLTMGSTSYGEGVETAAIKSGSPLSRTPDQRPMPAAEVRAAAMSPVTGLFDPSSRPEEDVMYGNKMGPGAGPEALMMKSAFAQTKLSDTLAEMLPYDQTGEIGILYQQALARGM